jgi:hypothetical protein
MMQKARADAEFPSDQGRPSGQGPGSLAVVDAQQDIDGPSAAVQCDLT